MHRLNKTPWEGEVDARVARQALDVHSNGRGHCALVADGAYERGPTVPFRVCQLHETLDNF